MSENIVIFEIKGKKYSFFLEKGEARRTGITSSETENDLANVDTGNGSVGLTPGTTHTSLQSIGTGT